MSVLETVRRAPGRAAAALVALAALLALASPAVAQMRHGGVPERIVADRRAGPYRVSLWAKPAVGMSMLYVVYDAPADASADAPFVAPTTVRVGVTPASGDGPEVLYDAHREPVAHGARYVAHVTFDRSEAWKVRVFADGPAGGGELRAVVRVPPAEGPGPLDLVLYSLPVTLIAGLWGRAALARRHSVARRPALAAP